MAPEGLHLSGADALKRKGLISEPGPPLWVKAWCLPWPARDRLAYVWIERLGERASDLARLLGQTRGNVSRAAKRGAATAQPWLKMMNHCCP